MKQANTSDTEVFPKLPGCLEEDSDDSGFAGLVVFGVGCASMGSLITWAVISWWPV